MTSKEMEARSGVPRANIRYYEAEGLLAPARSGNGYRDYSEEDLRTLEKIKLLRRLGVTIEALRALRDGRAELSAVLDRRLAEVGGEQAALGRVERVCGDLRRTGATFTGLDPGRYLADLDAPALPGEGGPWWEKASASALPETDRLPTVCSASRRLFARMFDEMLVRMLLVAGLCLLGYNRDSGRTGYQSRGGGPAGCFGTSVPASLGHHAGQALLGMRLAGMDGKNLPYSEGVTRYLMMLWTGLGFYIPVLSLVMILRSAWRCWKEEPQPWDDGVAYTAKPFRLRYAASLILTVLLVLIVGEAVNSWSQLPPNRGDLTVAEFAENYNRQAEYLDFGGRAYLDEDGQWQEKPEDGSQIISLEDLMDVNPWDDAKAFHYTVEDGHVTAVTMSGTFQNTTAMWVETPDS